ncbi:MAG TPA: biotin--[acetyl-CoA-carboxylase] ligase [Candidatus Polarisedimenticolia bacterium]|nr:biotin--[acetyl-CoA-carboxylase] ligase [Candidatus Polarisedimenticolia bacterium]
MIAGRTDLGEILDRLARRRAERGGSLAWSLAWHETVESTNDLARELAASGSPEGTVVLAGEQTRGRGRSGRTWHSPPGQGLYASVLLRPQAAPAHVPLVGLLAGIAAAEALAGLSGAEVRVQWPNDLVAGDRPGRSPAEARRKVGGILVEARTSAGALRDVVAGIGINLAQREGEFPPDIAHRAVSLETLSGRAIGVTVAAAAVLGSLDGWYTLWGGRDHEAVLSAYRRLAVDLEGTRVRVHDGGPPWEGLTAGLADDGALRVRRSGPGGRTAALRYGEVQRVEEI